MKFVHHLLPLSFKRFYNPESLKHNITELEHQTEALRTLLKHCMNSPPSPTDQVLNQLIKNCQLAMHSTVILTNKNQELKVTNQKQWQKKSKTQSYITTEGSLIDAEGIYHT